MNVLSNDAVARMQSLMQLPDVDERYEAAERIGQGGMGLVYRAFDRVLERDVAIKVTSALVDDSAVRRLSREARILARLEHPGIVSVHDAGVTPDGRPWYAMRLVRGVRLDRWVVHRTRGERLRLFLQVCDAIGFAHAQHVVHRDIKPGNIMVGEYGEVLVLDWGVAKVGDDVARGVTTGSSQDTQDGVVVGTPGFMAPEQASGTQHAVDFRADIYALGMLLRWLSTDEKDQASRPLAAIGDRAAAPDVTARYQDVASLAADVRRWLDGERVTAYRERWWERVKRFYLRNQTILLLFLTYAVVRMIILLWRGV